MRILQIDVMGRNGICFKMFRGALRGAMTLKRLEEFDIGKVRGFDDERLWNRLSCDVCIWEIGRYMCFKKVYSKWKDALSWENDKESDKDEGVLKR